MVRRFWGAALVIAVLASPACSRPTESGLRDSFAQQVAANKFVKDFHRSGDDLAFSAPDTRGNTARWRIHVDSAVVEPQDDPAQPYKGTVKSSWFVNDEHVVPRGRDSNLPVELLDNGLSQDCWAFWVAATKRWSWE